MDANKNQGNIRIRPMSAALAKSQVQPQIQQKEEIQQKKQQQKLQRPQTAQQFSYKPEIIQTLSIEYLEKQTKINSLKFELLKNLTLTQVDDSIPLHPLGSFFPSLQTLNINKYPLMTPRSLGTDLQNIKQLSLMNCKLSSLDGIQSLFPLISELYLSFNMISSLEDLFYHDKLEILEIEGNLLKNQDWKKQWLGDSIENGLQIEDDSNDNWDEENLIIHELLREDDKEIIENGQSFLNNGEEFSGNALKAIKMRRNNDFIQENGEEKTVEDLIKTFKVKQNEYDLVKNTKEIGIQEEEEDLDITSLDEIEDINNIDSPQNEDKSRNDIDQPLIQDKGQILTAKTYFKRTNFKPVILSQRFEDKKAQKCVQYNKDPSSIDINPKPKQRLVLKRFSFNSSQQQPISKEPLQKFQPFQRMGSINTLLEKNNITPKRLIQTNINQQHNPARFNFNNKFQFNKSEMLSKTTKELNENSSQLIQQLYSPKQQIRLQRLIKRN